MNIKKLKEFLLNIDENKEIKIRIDVNDKLFIADADMLFFNNSSAKELIIGGVINESNES